MRKPSTRSVTKVVSALLATTIGMSCDDIDDNVAYYDPYGYDYYDPYLYSYYYPSDLAYASTYYAYDWGYDSWYYYQTTGQGGGGGGTGGPALGSIGSAIRGLARNENICPGQVTVTPKTGEAACGDTSTRNGATIVFNDCALTGGGRVSGTIDIEASATAPRPMCEAGDQVTVTFTSTATDLTYTSTNGQRIVFPNQRDSGTISFPFGQQPTMFTVNSMGSVRFEDANGNVRADVATDGTRVYTNSGDGQAYTVDGTLNLQPQNGNTGGGTIIGTGIVRSSGCCRPTSGTMVMSLNGGARPGRQTFTFGPTCGDVSIDGTAVTLPACQ